MSRALAEISDPEVRLLDVGAGPLTTMGKVYPGKRLEIVPVDPLAPAYDRLLKELEIEPLVRTIEGHGERLDEQFAPESFHLAHARNAIDHAYDPVAVMRSMLAVVKPGGAVVLRHNVNEGENEGYRGFHQWNFDVRSGDFWIWNLAAEVNVTERVREIARVESYYEDRYVVSIMWKDRVPTASAGPEEHAIAPPLADA